MRTVLAAAAMAGIMTGGTALAQQAAPAQPSLAQPTTQTAAEPADVSGFLCTFAGKCGTEQAVDDTPTKAAPQTKGFRLATSQVPPTIPAPETKGFRVATGASQPTTAAPATRGFRVARSATAQPVTPAPIRRATRVQAASQPRRYVSPVAARAAVAPGAARAPATPGQARADLMLTFEYNSAAMTRTAETRARGFAQALMMPELKDKRFLIEGHTDASGSRDLNVELSRRRAQTVADFLVAQGVDRARVEVKGVGPDEPLPGRAATAEANRRVEAVLLS